MFHQGRRNGQASRFHGRPRGYRPRRRQLVVQMRAAAQRDFKSSGDGRAIVELYDRPPLIDFSRDILSEQESRTRALPVPPCGWSDLGTPERVAHALGRAPRREWQSEWPGALGQLNLAAQLERLQRGTVKERSFTCASGDAPSNESGIRNLAHVPRFGREMQRQRCYRDQILEDA
jgi:hypothetical protein